MSFFSSGLSHLKESLTTDKWRFLALSFSVFLLGFKVSFACFVLGGVALVCSLALFVWDSPFFLPETELCEDHSHGVWKSYYIHPDGWRFVIPGLVVAIIICVVNLGMGLLAIACVIWCVFFFRDPPRITPLGKNFIISPADGHVASVSEVVPDESLGLGSSARTRISIFLNIFDVHVTRIPYAGKIRQIAYHPGKFFNASLDKASLDNERNCVVIEAQDGSSFAVIQIAGLIARRIRCDISAGDVVSAGQRFGIIRFGSRVDLYLPENLKSLVIPGQIVIGGETIMADMDYQDTHLTGRILP